MFFLIIHNEYRDKGGEESVVAFQKHLLESKGHKVRLYTRSYQEAEKWFLGKMWTTFTSIYNYKSIRDIKKIIKEEKPDVAIIHNVFSIISPAIIPLLKKNGVKVWQIVHNYRLFCPIGIFFNQGEICEKCLGKHREWNCFKNHCTEKRLSDFSFALKFSIVRKCNYYKYVDKFFSLSQFQKQILASNGIDEEKIIRLPNTYTPLETPPVLDFDKKNVIGFVGRLTKEKGFFDFISLAKQMPEYEFCVAGKITKEIENYELPKNLKFEGFLDKKQMSAFYSKCKVVLFLSRWYEGFPMVLVEALYHYTPLIVNDLSVMAEVVKDDYNGYKVEIGDVEAIKDKINLLFSDNEAYKTLTFNCRKDFDENYSVENYYNRLIQTN